MYDYLKFLGLVGGLKFIYDLKFYFAIIAAQFFYIVLSFFTKPSFHADMIFQIIMVQLFTAFIEELIFRGAFFGFIKEYIKHNYFKISAANLFSALLFTVFHFFHHSPIWALGTFIPALIFGYFREKYSLWSAVFLHFLYNFEYFLLF